MARPGAVRRVLLCGGALFTLAAAAAGYVYLERPRPVQDRTAGHQKMVAILRDIERRTPEEHWLLNEREARELRAYMAAPPPEASPTAMCGGYYHLGMAELKLGREQEAIDALTKAYNMLPGLKGALKNADALNVIFYLGVACMRLGETQNCCARHTPDSCLLPIQGGGIHTNPEGSRGAIGHFLEVLSATHEQEPAHLQARWLLNIAYMTLGEYPDKVPSIHLIPPQAFASDEPFLRFPNIAHRLGLDTFHLAGGAVADDFDNDGYLDLIVSSSDTSEHLRYFHNNQDGTFTDRSEPAGLTGLLGGLNIVQGDYNNDGNVDFLVLRGGWLFDKGRYPNSLVRNNGDGTFVDVTFSAGLGEVFYPKQTASFADYDNDGDLDIYIGNESTQSVTAPCQLFRNNGDETFTDVAREAGVTNDRFAKSVVWGDYDGDGLPDIYVGNLGEPNRLYHNLGDGTFIDMAPRLGVTLPAATFPTWFWDFDNDGALDIFATSYAGDIADLAAAALGLPFESDLPHLYRGDGKGGFVEVGKDLGLRKPNFPMGANFGDLDGDGYLDFYLGTGDPDYMNLMPNVMYHNRRGKGFADVTTNGGFGNLQKGHAVVFADFDNDGDQDIFEQMGGAYRGDRYNDSFYENPGFGNHWISVRLVGVRSNRSGIGARIHVVILENGQPRSIYKHVNSGGTFGANPLRQNIGLGKATEIVSLEVLWPTTGKTQTFEKVAMDQFVELVEGAAQLRTIELKKLRLGGESAEKSR
jgi:ASPIC/UnbV protein/VCBS repeat protein